MKVNCYRWTCLLFCFLAANLFAQENPQIQQPKPVQEDSAQVSVSEDSSKTSSAQTSNVPQKDDSKLSLKDAMPWLVALAALLFGIYQYIQRKEDTKQKKLAELEAQSEHKEKQQQQKTKTAEQRYRDAPGRRHP